MFTANFNKIVKAGISIKSFIFTFNIPDSDLKLNKEKISQFINQTIEKPIVSNTTEKQYQTHNDMTTCNQHKNYENIDEKLVLLPLKHSVSENPNTLCKIDSQVKVATGKKLSIKSKSFSSDLTNKRRTSEASSTYQDYNTLENTNQFITKYTPFERFLLSTTPFVMQLLENDTLLSIFSEIESVWDLGAEIYYSNWTDNSPMWDVYLPTLKSINWYSWNISSSGEYTNYQYTEDEPLYQRMPLIEKLNDINDSDPLSPFSVPIINIISSSSWMSIEWNLHYTSNRFKQKSQK